MIKRFFSVWVLAFNSSSYPWPHTHTHTQSWWFCSFIYPTLKPGAGMLFSKSSAAVALSWPVNSGNEGRYIPLLEGGGTPWSSIVIDITLTCSMGSCSSRWISRTSKNASSTHALKVSRFYLRSEWQNQDVHGGLLEPLVAIVISFDIIWMSNNPKKNTIQQSICCLITTWYYAAKGQGLIDTQQCRADIPYNQQRVEIYFNNTTLLN